MAPVHPSLLLESPTTVGGFFVPEDRFLWLRRAALLFRVLAALAIVGGAIVSVMVILEERSNTPSEPLLRLFSILVGTGCAVIVQLAFAQAIDFFVRFGERADERAERATRRRIDLASRRA